MQNQQQLGGGGGAVVGDEDQKLGDLGIAEAASPISSRPPAQAAIRNANFEEMIQATAEAGGSASNRWPRQETLALLQIRSEMDAAFRDATLKGPLWEQVSRKLGELGYRRSAKKCKEKFENVHKYYKRTKEGRGGRQDGKSYKFFTQLEALHHNVPPPPAAAADPAAALFGISFSSDGSSSDDEEMEEMEMQTNPPQRKRKRAQGGGDERMMEFFEGLLKQVMQKQEEMQQKFLEAIEKREHDRMIREEAWKRQDMARVAREHEIMAQERAVSASRDAAIVDFLQKITGQTIHLPSTATPPAPTPPAPAPAPVPTPPAPAPAPVPAPAQTDTAVSEQQQQQHQMMMMVPAAAAVQDTVVGETSSSRWPKPEVLALIKLRSGMEPRYQEPGPKGPLWEEISTGMQQLGYSRSAKRCKEKWENINKYFKKVKESNKKRPQDAKTCPYFDELDALYRRKVLTATNVDVGAVQGGVSEEDRAEQQQTPAAFPTSNPFGGGEKQPADMLDKGHQHSWGDTYCNTIHCSNSDEDNYEEDDETNVEEYDDKDMKMVYNNIQFQRQNVGSSNGTGGASSFVAMVQ